MLVSVTVPLASKQEFGEIPQSPALLSELCQRKAQEGEEAPCFLCGGTGVLPRYKDPCLRCGGTGRLRAVYYVRLNFGDDEEKRLAALEGVRWAEARGKQVKALLRLAERGRAERESGRAAVICGLRGEKMSPQRGWASPNGEHAVFWLNRGLEVTYSWSPISTGGTVNLVEVDPELHIKFTWLWSFFRERPDEPGGIVP